MRLTLLVFSVVSLSAGCNSVQKGACKKLTKRICDSCTLDDWSEMTCTCIENGTLEVNDVPDSASHYLSTAEEAEKWCFELNLELERTYQTDEQVAVCRQDLAYFAEYGDEACEDWGYGKDTGW